MNTENKLIEWFKVISIMAIIWNLFGTFAFVNHELMSNKDILLLPIDQQEIYLNETVLSTATFAIAVFTGLIGSILLFMRNKWASKLLILSVIVSLFQYLYNLASINIIETYGVGHVIMPIVVIFIGALIAWYAKIILPKLATITNIENNLK